MASSSTPNLPTNFMSGLRILLVDDERLCLKIIGRMLRACNHRVTTVERGRAALRILAVNKGAFDLVITDLYMPEMNGFQLTDEVVTTDKYMPVIMISVDTRQEIAMQSLQAGACYFIMKPISKEEVNNLWQHVYKKHLEQPADGFGCERCARGAHSTRNDRRGGARRVGGGREAVWEEGESSSRKGKSKYKIIKKYYRPRTSGKPRTIEGEVEGEKARVHWHPELHMKFLEAYQEIVKRKSKPIPKTIHEFMGVPGITRENVASHLQKYRMYLQQLEAMREAEKNSIENAPRSFKALYGSIPPRSSGTPIPLLPATLPPPPPSLTVSQPQPPPPMPSLNIPPQHIQGIIDYNFVDNFPYTFPIAPPPPPPAHPTTDVGLTGLLLESDFTEVDGFLRSREASPARMSFAGQYNEIDLEELFSQELLEGTGNAEPEQPLDVSDYQIDDFELRTDLPEETQP